MVWTLVAARSTAQFLDTARVESPEMGDRMRADEHIEDAGGSFTWALAGCLTDGLPYVWRCCVRPRVNSLVGFGTWPLNKSRTAY